MEKLINVIKEEIVILEQWATESKNGGWSTHQVNSQLKRAQELKSILYDLNK